MTMGAPGAFWSADDVRIDEIIAIIDEQTDLADYPHARRVEGNAVWYDMADLAPIVGDTAGRQAVMSEMARVFESGPGILVIKHAVDPEAVDRATTAFHRIIDHEKASGLGTGDHFAKVGANDRVWNALEKLAVEAPEVFVDYYGSDGIALASEAWLGPAYQMTSQVNVVNPGGQAQSPHRDYHLGFMTDEQAARFPGHVHRLSGALTLQGAIAHGEVSVEAGSTKVLPHSQKYPLGYLAWRRPDVIELFEQRFQQFELESGDAVFFNPALFHAAGTNRTADVRRMANLLQVSSAFGRAMESVDRARMAVELYPYLQKAVEAGVSRRSIDNAIACAAEGYPFPTNLDRDPPIGGLAPESQADLVRAALDGDVSVEELRSQLQLHAEKRLTA